MSIWIWLFHFFFPLLLILSSMLHAMADNESECDALLQFSNSFTISKTASQGYCHDYPSSITSYPKTISWKNGTDCCLWDGVRCSSAANQVIGLDLSCSWLRGRLHSNSTLFSLSNLRHLNLAGNYFAGSQIPPEFGIFTRMEYINLSNSGFSGHIPPEMIFHLSNVVTLDLSYNFGDRSTYPLSFLTVEEHSLRWLLRNFTRLRELVLDCVDMSKISPTSITNLSTSITSLSLSLCDLQGIFLTDIFYLPNLRRLSISRNFFLTGTLPQTNWTSPLISLDLTSTNFHGSIPALLGNLSSLNYLDLSNSGFSGPVPPTLQNLDHLTHLDLGGSNLSGTVDFEMFERLKSLHHLSLGGNNLSLLLGSDGNCSFPRLKFLYLSYCNLTEFPYFLRSSLELEILHLYKNMISGRIPGFFWRMVGDKLTLLDLSFNNFTGQLPVNFLLNSSVDFINMANNKFDGPLPIPPPTVGYYSVSNNLFSGVIPHQFCNASELYIINLSNNGLNGTIPHCFTNFSAPLEVVDLRANKFIGQIPEISVPKSNSLKTIRLSQNQLEGTLPQSLALCKNLEVLDLSENELEGSFPYWLDTLPNLQVLALRSNKFDGLVDYSSKTDCPFPKLRILDLSRNSFSGLLPAKYLANLIAMKNEVNGVLEYMSSSYDYQDSVVVEMKGSEVELVKIYMKFTSIDFSSNFFEGEIPEIIGDLKALKGLNMSHNNLSGNIPSSMGNLTNLEWMDLSSNRLSGKIPRGLAILTSLSCLNLSDNQLSGPIPQSTQFDTFSHSFDGNPELCGRPLPKACGNDVQQGQPSTSHEEEEAESDNWIKWRAVPMGYACGLAFGISAGYIVLKTGRPRWLAIMVEWIGSRKTNRPEQNVSLRNFGRRSRRDQ